MALQLNRVTHQIDAMGAALADRQAEQSARLLDARGVLGAAPLVTDELLAKIHRAEQSDAWRRGATPYGARLDERHLPAGPTRPATLIAADGSQIYPDRHAIASFFLVNTGSIVLRQDSGEAPEVDSVPELFFSEADLYGADGQMLDVDQVNSVRDQRELATLTSLAERERTTLGGNPKRPILTLLDGPLLPWMASQDESSQSLRARMRQFGQQMERLRACAAIPVGFVDRPGSAYVLRILELIQMELEQIDREALRQGPFRQLTDRLLFADLKPGQRSALFVPASAGNRLCREVTGVEIAFFYMNMALQPGAEPSILARVEVPDWIASDSDALDCVQTALYEECRFTGFPYVMARAHELAVVGASDRRALETMIGQVMLRHELVPAPSGKAAMKLATGG